MRSIVTARLCDPCCKWHHREIECGVILCFDAVVCGRKGIWPVTSPPQKVDKSLLLGIQPSLEFGVTPEKNDQWYKNLKYLIEMLSFDTHFGPDLYKFHLFLYYYVIPVACFFVLMLQYMERYTSTKKKFN